SLGRDLAEMLQRRHQPRHADGEAGRRHRLAAKTRDQSVVASTAADRAEANRFAVLTRDGERQLNLVDRARIIFEPAHDRPIYLDASLVIPCGANQVGDAPELRNPVLAATGCS